MTANRRPMLVIYHGGCPDGFTAAWVVHKAYPEAEFHPGVYGQAPPDVAGRDVILVDFSYKRPVLEEMASEANSILLLDHHATAQADLLPLVEGLSRVRQIPLSDGTVAYVDEQDFDKVSAYSWSRAAHGGAIAYAGGGREDQTSIYMHRLVTGAPDGVLVDHYNRNTVDNRRGNLRFASRQQNAANMDRGSQWKGVRAHGTRWVAQISVLGTNTYLGSFDTPEEAARAYDAAAMERFGEFARLNFDERPKLPPPNMKVVFDMQRSGAGIAWDHLFPGQPRPWLVDYAEDRDLWRWALPMSKEVSAWVMAQPHTFATWDGLMSLGMMVAKERGAAILLKVEQYVEVMGREAIFGTFAGHEGVPIVNAPMSNISDVLGALAEKHGLAVGWFVRRDGMTQYSLRSRGELDVAEMARRYGGGGHKNAAGFQLFGFVHTPTPGAKR